MDVTKWTIYKTLACSEHLLPIYTEEKLEIRFVMLSMTKSPLQLEFLMQDFYWNAYDTTAFTNMKMALGWRVLFFLTACLYSTHYKGKKVM